jgi:hypothetical protein
MSCEACQLSKHHRVSFPSRVVSRVSSPFELVHSDVWGPINIASNKFHYFVTFVDDFSRMTWLFLMKNRSEWVVVNRCWLCESDGESVNHLLLHCGAARALWNAFFVRFGLYWVMPCSVKELLACWWSCGRSRSAVVWKMVPLCIMWCIWSERNLRCFEDSSRSIEDLLHFFMYTLFSWTAGWLAPRAISFSEFLSLFSPSP